MKYLIFSLTIFGLLVRLVKFTGLNMDGRRITRFGYGYITGQLIIILLLALLAYLAGRKIFRSES